MDSPKISADQRRLIEQLAALGEAYSRPGFSPYKDPTLGFGSALVDELEEFGQLMYRENNRDLMGVEDHVGWMESPTGQRFLGGDASILEAADFKELMTAWVVLQRRDYWSQPDRSLPDDYESGLIPAVTARAAALLATGTI